MSEHPIDGLMETAMNSIKDMVDVNTIIGDPIEASNGMVIIPISKVSFGFSINPVAFVVVLKDSIKILPIEHNSAIDKLMDYVPDLMEKANNIVDKTIENNEKTSNIDIPSKKPNLKNPIKTKDKIIKKLKNDSNDEETLDLSNFDDE